MDRKQQILKVVLLLRAFNRQITKEEQVEKINGWFDKGCLTDQQLQDWISALKDEASKTGEQIEKEAKERIERLAEWDSMDSQRDFDYTEKYYSPSNPWDAPGMSIHDFI